MDSFLTLNDVEHTHAADEETPATVAWTKLPRSSSLLEQGAKPCCRATVDDRGALRYAHAHDYSPHSQCDVLRCTFVTNLCLKMPNASAATVAALRAVRSATLAFSSLFQVETEVHRPTKTTSLGQVTASATRRL